MKDLNKEITSCLFSKKKSYVINHDNKEWVYIKVDTIKESYLSGDCVFSKQDRILENGKFLLEIRNVIDFREATDMENYFFLHHYNAINYKRFTMSRINDILNSKTVSNETKQTVKKLKIYLDI